MRSRGRSVAEIAALTLVATLCAAAVATVRGDNGRLAFTDIATAASLAPVEHPGQAAKREAARKRIRAARRIDDLSWPLRGAVTGRFGEPRGGRRHEGIDIPLPEGTPIRAASDGTVVLREPQAGYGKYTCVAHRRISTCYGHQSRFRTAMGAAVRRGQVIGYVGSTGYSETNHLHFEVRRGTRPWGTAVDPAKFLPRKR